MTEKIPFVKPPEKGEKTAREKTENGKY